MTFLDQINVAFIKPLISNPLTLPLSFLYISLLINCNHRSKEYIKTNVFPFLLFSTEHYLKIQTFLFQTQSLNFRWSKFLSQRSCRLHLVKKEQVYAFIFCHPKGCNLLRSMWFIKTGFIPFIYLPTMIILPWKSSSHFFSPKSNLFIYF